MNSHNRIAMIQINPLKYQFICWTIVQHSLHGCFICQIYVPRGADVTKSIYRITKKYYNTLIQ